MQVSRDHAPRRNPPPRATVCNAALKAWPWCIAFIITKQFKSQNCNAIPLPSSTAGSFLIDVVSLHTVSLGSHDCQTPPHQATWPCFACLTMREGWLTRISRGVGRWPTYLPAGASRMSVITRLHRTVTLYGCYHTRTNDTHTVTTTDNWQPNNRKPDD
jgi:hypothetical protein